MLPNAISQLTPIEGAQLTVHNGAGTIMGGSGAIPLLGVAKLCLFALCDAPPPGNLSIPLSVVGAGGMAFSTALVNVTARGAPWTVGTAEVGTLTRRGFAHGPSSITSSTAAAPGTLKPACGREVRTGARFCVAGCGARLDSGAPTASLQDAVESGQGERLQLTVLFCDLRGLVPPLIESDDPS